MKRIMIKDLAKEVAISIEELRVIRGGISPQPEPPRRWYPGIYSWHTVGELSFKKFPGCP